MSDKKKEWDKHVTPKLGISDVMQSALDWWNELPIQCLENMDDSRVGYFRKYYPNKKTPMYWLTGEDVQHIYENEDISYKRDSIINDILN